VDLGGASVGFQAGVESADVVLVFRTRDSLDRIRSAKGKLTLGADAAIAAGPVGRQPEAGTDAQLRAEIWSYSRSRGPVRQRCSGRGGNSLLSPGERGVFAGPEPGGGAAHA
jgi:lipid-binding SYLF domain-containing protein